MLSKELDDVFGASDATVPHGEPMDFGQHFADAMATAQPAPAPVTNAPAPAAEPVEDDHVLDFDLGGLAFEPVEPMSAPQPAKAADDEPDFEFDMSSFEKPAAPVAAAAIEPAVALDQTEQVAQAEHEPLDFSFDMDFATPAANPVPHMEAHTDDDLLAPAAATAAAADIEMANLAREFDLPDLPTELQANLPAEPQPASAEKDPLFDLDAMDFGAPATAAASPASIPPAALDEHLFDIPATPATAGAPFAEPDRIVLEPATPQFDVGGFDLDLPSDGSLPLPEVQTLSEPQFAAPAAADVPPLSPAHMEMETKLDLAIAYQEIGDKEGARELLEEVIRGGNPEQAARANSMRAALA
jgi:pilus assembly protein FimV